MELREFEYMIAIAEEGSISKAADRLYLAQSSLSQYLNRYEAELGIKLFMRTTKGIRPTLAGEIYLNNARQMLNKYRLMKTELGEMARPTEGRIEFGISTFRGGFLIPKVLAEFKERAPAVDVVIHELDSVHIQKRIAAGELDMGLAAFHDEEWRGQGKRIKRDEVILIARKSHPVMQYVKVSDGGPNRLWVDLKQISHLEFLLSPRPTMLGASAEKLFAEAGYAPRCVNSNLTAPMAKALAEYGLGLAFTYRSCVTPNPDLEYLTIGAKGYYINLALMYPPEGYRSRAVRALEECIRYCLYEECE